MITKHTFYKNKLWLLILLTIGVVLPMWGSGVYFEDWSFDIPSPHFKTQIESVENALDHASNHISTKAVVIENIQQKDQSHSSDLKKVSTLNFDAFLLALGQSLEERYGFEGMMEIQLLSQFYLPYIDVPYWNINLIEVPKNMASRMSVVFNIKTDKEVFGPFRILIQAQCWQEVYFTKDRILSKHGLNRGDFESHKIDVLSYHQSLVPLHVDLKNYELLHTLSAHKPLLWRDITRKPTIRKGKMVNAIGRNGLLTLSMKCEATTNGFEGEFITLRNLQTRKEFQGRVQNQDTVEIYF